MLQERRVNKPIKLFDTHFLDNKAQVSIGYALSELLDEGHRPNCRENAADVDEAAVPVWPFN